IRNRVVLAGTVAIALWGVAAHAGSSAEPGSDEGPLPAIITNSLRMKLALIPAGEFLMGAPGSDQDAGKDESPQFRVRITRRFYIGVHEVTVEQFRSFVDDTGHKTAAETEESSGYNGDTQTFQYNRHGFNWRNLGWKQADDHPVLNVTWFDAV